MHRARVPLRSLHLLTHPCIIARVRLLHLSLFLIYGHAKLKHAGSGHARALCEVGVCVVRPLLLSSLGAFNKGEGRMGEKGKEGEAKDAPIMSHADAAFFRPSARHVSRCLAQRCLS